jgi:diaminopimelate decarboxylase
MILKEDQYFFSGELPVLDIAARYDTPLYVYEGEVMAQQYQRMVKALDVPASKICYACKANSNIHVLRLFQALGAGLDCVSIQEVELGLLAGFAPDDILYTPNCVSLEEYEGARQKGVRINIDNISILEQYGNLHPGAPVCIRVNPHIMAGGNSKISTGHIDSKFGISIHQLPHVLRVVEATGLHIAGLHMHTGSDILDVEVFLNACDILFGIAGHFPDLEYIDFGSGFKVPYKPDDISTDIEEFGEQISARFREFCLFRGRDLTLMFEPGKFLVSEAGTFLARTNVIKTTVSTVFAGLDTGLNHLIRPMFYNAHHSIENVSNPGGRPRIYTIVGYICETDTFGTNRRLSEVHEGDILAFRNAGAYGWAMSSNYNSRFRPAEVLIWEGKDYLIRRRENLEDLLALQDAQDPKRPSFVNKV